MRVPPEVPSPIVLALEERLGAALQIIAALILTDDEATDIARAREPTARCAQWASMMRADLCTRRTRAELVEVLRREGFLTNSHAGFPVGILREAMPPIECLVAAYRALDTLDTRRLTGPDVQHAVLAVLTSDGVEPAAATWALQHGGHVRVLSALATQRGGST